MYKVITIVSFWLLLVSNYAIAQKTTNDTKENPRRDINKLAVTGMDSTESFPLLPEKKVFSPNPKKAAMLSTVIPGLGQVYNKKYWKIPIFATGFLITGYFAAYNNKRLIRVNKVIDTWPTNANGSPDQSILDANILDVPGYNIDSYQEAQRVRDRHRRDKDNAIIIMMIVYAANIVDAAVDAHLYQFKITKDVSVQIEPSFTPIYHANQMSTSKGLQLRLNF